MIDLLTFLAPVQPQISYGSTHADADIPKTPGKGFLFIGPEGENILLGGLRDPVRRASVFRMRSILCRGTDDYSKGRDEELTLALFDSLLLQEGVSTWARSRHEADALAEKILGNVAHVLTRANAPLTAREANQVIYLSNSKNVGVRVSAKRAYFNLLYTEGSALCVRIDKTFRPTKRGPSRLTGR